MSSVEACPGCGRAPLIRNGYRVMHRPDIDGGRLRWEPIAAIRYHCRGCGRDHTDQDEDLARLEAGIDLHLVGRVAALGVVAASNEAGCDRRTVGARVARFIDGRMQAPLPACLSVRLNGKSLLLADAGTDLVVEAVDNDPEALGFVLAERGVDVMSVVIPLDPRLRDAVAAALPDAAVSLHDADCLPRLDSLVRDASVQRDVREADLLAERVRGSGWDAGALDLLGAMADRRGLSMAKALLATWGDEIRATCARSRDGPSISLPSVPPLRLRAIVAMAAPHGLPIQAIRQALQNPDSIESAS